MTLNLKKVTRRSQLGKQSQKSSHSARHQVIQRVTTPRVFEVAPRHSLVGHSVEDEKVPDMNMSAYDSDLPISNEIGRVAAPQSIGEVPVGPLGEK